jgi:hypothetical protein
VHPINQVDIDMSARQIFCTVPPGNFAAESVGSTVFDAVINLDFYDFSDDFSPAPNPYYMLAKYILSNNLGGANIKRPFKFH